MCHCRSIKRDLPKEPHCPQIDKRDPGTLVVYEPLVLFNLGNDQPLRFLKVNTHNCIDIAFLPLSPRKTYFAHTFVPTLHPDSTERQCSDQGSYASNQTFPDFTAPSTNLTFCYCKMADLDAELLALAGGDTSSDEEDTSKTHTKTESPASSPTDPAGTQHGDAGIKLGVARKKSTKMSGGTKRAPKRAKKQESEEGEA